MGELGDWRTADEYTIDSSGNLRKSVTIYARKGSVIWPLAYIARPKWVSEDDFKAFIDALVIRVRLDPEPRLGLPS